MVSLDRSSSGGGLVKVKPKQIELVQTLSSSLGPRSRSRGSRRIQGSRSKISGNTHSSSDDGVEDLVGVLKAADEMFEIADTSGDGFISREEFEYYMMKKGGHTRETIREAFRTIDRDNDGEITTDEVRKAFLRKKREMMRRSGSGRSGRSNQSDSFEEELLQCSRDADALFRKADTSGDGYLSKREFEVYMKRNTKHSDLAIRELFSMMDLDNDGYITQDEVRHVFLQQKRHANGKGGLKKGDGQKMTMSDLLGLEDDELHELADDVYNMFFLSDTGGQGFFYALLVFALKSALFIIIAIDLLVNKSFPDKDEIPTLVKFAQFLLLPIACAIQEEIITTFYIYGNLKWSPTILELNPGAHKWKYHSCNILRLVDGCLFLFINTGVLLQAVDCLNMFLSFAALMFLQTIDNIGLHLARQGYLTESLEETAKDVLLMKLPKNHSSKLQILDSALLFSTYVVLVVAWLLVCVV